MEIPGTWMLLEFSLPRVNSTDAITLCLQRVSIAVRCLSDCLRCYPRTCAPFLVSDSACRDGLNTPSGSFLKEITLEVKLLVRGTEYVKL